MLMEALSKVHTDIPTYSFQFAESHVCDQATKQCLNNMYDECKDRKLFNCTLNGEVSIKWFPWDQGFPYWEDWESPPNSQSKICSSSHQIFSPSPLIH